MSKILSLFKQYGLGAISRIVKSIFRRLGFMYEVLLYFEKELDSEDIQNRLANYDYSDVQSLTLKDFDCCDYLDDNKKTLYKERFESGDYDVYGIFKDEILVYYSWISYKYIGLPFGFNEKIPLLESEALLEDSFCDPRYRGKGYHGKVNILRLKTILDKGKNKVVVTVLKGNTPAIKVQLKSGFTISKNIILSKMFSKMNIKHYKKA